MAYRTGIPQSTLRRRFTYNELQEIIAYKELDYERVSKEDVRVQRLGFWNAMCHASEDDEVDPDMFLIEWTRDEEDQEDQDDLEVQRINVEMLLESMAARFDGKIERF